MQPQPIIQDPAQYPRPLHVVGELITVLASGASTGYKPWQRGSNENANGIIRRYLPKGIDLSPFTDKNLADLEFVLNNMPRQILGFKTPHEAFSRIKVDHVAGVALQA